MTEISFARSFLSALDLRPTKLSSDYVADQREYAAQPAPTLPKHLNQPLKRKRTPSGADGSPATAAPSSEPAATVTLKNLKTSEAVTLQRQALSTSVYDLKSAYAGQTGGNVEKIKLLYNKKPVADSKTLKEVIGGEAGKEIVFSVMVLGGGGAAPAPATAGAGKSAVVETPSVAQGQSGKEVLRDEAFWEDLNGFLLQRVRDEAEAKRLSGLFKKAWESSS